MRLKPEQVLAHVGQKLLPVYLITGDEPLQVNECCDWVRRAARSAGCTERVILQVERGFDWGDLYGASHSMSLFSERKLIELRLATGKVEDVGVKALTAFLAAPSIDNLLLISAPKLDKLATGSAWLGTLERVGALVQVWPIETRQLPGWITARVKSKGLTISAGAAALLAERIEGNLLAAAQEIEQLALVAHGSIDEAMVVAVAGDSAKYDVFGFAEAAFVGDVERLLRIGAGLRVSAEPPYTLWALARELRIVTRAAAVGASFDDVVRSEYVAEPRARYLRAAVKRHSAARWRRILRFAAHVDRVAKGLESGNVWDEMVKLALAVAGADAVGAVA